MRNKIVLTAVLIGCCWGVSMFGQPDPRWRSSPRNAPWSIRCPDFQDTLPSQQNRGRLECLGDVCEDLFEAMGTTTPLLDSSVQTIDS
jgi:hypothetical protein